MFGGSGSIQLARIAGIRIGASPSWFVVLFVSILFLSWRYDDVFDQNTAYVLAVLAAVLFFGSLLLHELGHAFAARREGISIAGIDLWFFGGVAKLNRDSRTAGEEFRVAAAGPAVTLVIALASLGVAALVAGDADLWQAVLLDVGIDDPVFALFSWLAFINGILLVFNLVPAFPLDGGRIARAVAWRITGDRTRSTVISARLGQGFGYLLIGYGAFLAFGRDATFNGLYIAVLGWFLAQAARGAIATSAFQESIEGVTVGDLMDRQPVALPAGTPAGEAVTTHFARYGWPWFPVVADDGRFLGILPREAVDAAAPERPSGELLDPAEAGAFRVEQSAPLEELLASEPLARLGALMVVDEQGRLAGVVTIEQVRRALAAAAPA